MRVRIVSDLHFEFSQDGGVAICDRIFADPSFDVAVVAGDLCDFGTLSQATRLVASKAAGRHVVYVLGNHEFYGGSLGEALNKVREVQREFPNFHFLEQSWTLIEGRRFLGCTLWYPLPVISAEDLGWSDFGFIANFRMWGHARAVDSADFLRRQAGPGDIVVTHFLPHPASIADEFRGSAFNKYYVNDLTSIVERSGASLWLHGHTHKSRDYYVVGGARVVCNPFGYEHGSRRSDEPNSAFNPALTIEI